MKEFCLQDKLCVITGAGGILCSAFARAVAACGAKVALLDLNLERAKQVAGEIEQSGGKALPVLCNVLDKDSLCAAKKVIHDTFGPIDILINGAGGNNPRGTTDKEFFEAGDLDKEELKTFFNLDPEGIRFVFDLNFLGTLLPTQIFAEDMARNRAGVILNVSSMNAFTPLTKIPAYSAAKASVSNFTQWLAVHFAGVGIRVNAIAPGFFITAQNHDMLINPDGSYSKRAEKILTNTPMARFGEPDELLGTVLYLLDDKFSGFVTGVVVPVDGGFSAYSGV